MSIFYTRAEHKSTPYFSGSKKRLLVRQLALSFRLALGGRLGRVVVAGVLGRMGGADAVAVLGQPERADKALHVLERATFGTADEFVGCQDDGLDIFAFGRMAVHTAGLGHVDGAKDQRQTL